MTDSIVAPHGGRLIQLQASADEARELREQAAGWPSWYLTPRQLCDLELLICGAFSPLDGFMGRRDVESVCSRMRLADGTLWPLPMTLDVDEALADELAAKAGSAGRLALRDGEGVIRAALEVQEVWQPDRRELASLIFGTLDPGHPGVAHRLERSNAWSVTGRLRGVEAFAHYDFSELRQTPTELRGKLAELGWKRVVGFQTRNPLHRAHVEMTLRAAEEQRAGVLIQPVVGDTKAGDVGYYTRVRCYQALLPRLPKDRILLSLIPLAMRMAGPREALLHAIVRKNFGCTHFIVGRDHAGPGEGSDGKPFYEPYAAQDLVTEHQEELGIRCVPFKRMVYVEPRRRFLPVDEVTPGETVSDLSGTEIRRRLSAREEIPDWFSYPEVVAELRRAYPPRDQQGLTVFFTGLPAAGKSTLARALRARLLEVGSRPVSLLDGDLVRRLLSSGLGFSREDRDLNIRRIGYVATEITRAGGVALCAPIAPYDEVRREIRGSIEEVGTFVLVYVATALELCEKRDPKGLYTKARAGMIDAFTGISDPYEPPPDADLVVDTRDTTPQETADLILCFLQRRGYVPKPGGFEALVDKEPG